MWGGGPDWLRCWRVVEGACVAAFANLSIKWCRISERKYNMAAFRITTASASERPNAHKKLFAVGVKRNAFELCSL